MLALDQHFVVWRSDADWSGYSDPLVHNATENHTGFIADGDAHGN